MGARSVLNILAIFFVLVASTEYKMAFNAKGFYDDFVSKPSVGELDKLKKSEILDLGKYLELDVSAALRDFKLRF